MPEYKDNEQKLLAIQNIVGELFGVVDDPYLIDRLMSIDSICDVPLEGEF